MTVIAVQMFKPQPPGEPWQPQEAANVEWVLIEFSDYIPGSFDMKGRAETLAVNADPKYATWKVGPTIVHDSGITILKDPMT